MTVYSTVNYTHKLIVTTSCTKSASGPGRSCPGDVDVKAASVHSLIISACDTKHCIGVI